LGKVSRPIPTMLDYRTHVEHGSVFNTPPVLPIYHLFGNVTVAQIAGGCRSNGKDQYRKSNNAV